MIILVLINSSLIKNIHNNDHRNYVMCVWEEMGFVLTYVVFVDTKGYSINCYLARTLCFMKSCRNTSFRYCKTIEGFLDKILLLSLL